MFLMSILSIPFIYFSLAEQIGAVFIWTYVYNIVRAYGIRSTGSTINRTNSANGGEIVTESSLEESLLSKDIETDHSHDTPQPIESIENYEKVDLLFSSSMHSTNFSVSSCTRVSCHLTEVFGQFYIFLSTPFISESQREQK